MGDTTQISWTDATFNPWWGCEKVSPACAHCYAERDANRYGNRGLWGSGHKIRFLSDANWQKPMLWAARARDGLLPDGSPNPDGHRPRVFTASMADVFEEREELLLPRFRLLRLIEKTPELDWLVLTKRPEEALRHWPEPPPNVWLGVSVENEAWTWRADVLREIPAAVRFLSCEPLLGTLFPKITFGPGIPGEGSDPANVKADPVSEYEPNAGTESGGTRPSSTEGRGSARRGPLDLTGIHWVIIGGESGPRGKARPMHPEWAREIRDHVQAANLSGADIALHMKQWGSWTPDPFGRDPNAVWVKRDGNRVSSFQADVYGIDLTGAVRMRYAGPRPGDGGKFLDGAEHCEFPASPELVVA